MLAGLLPPVLQIGRLDELFVPSAPTPVGLNRGRLPGVIRQSVADRLGQEVAVSIVFVDAYEVRRRSERTVHEF